MKTYLVTGGCGFIGSHFIRYILQKYEDVRVINLDAMTYAASFSNLGPDVLADERYRFVKGDVCDGQLVSDIFRCENICRVINFAAESHVDRSIVDPVLFNRTNTAGTLNLLQCARRAWKESDGKFVQISTDEVYGSAEQTFTEDSVLRPSSPYAASKAAADMYVTAFGRTYGLCTATVRSGNNYGENQYREKLIPLFFNRAVNMDALPLYGDGNQRRAWLYAGDNCRAVDLVSEKGEGIFNVPGNCEHTNAEIAAAVVDYVSKHINADVGPGLIRHVADRPGHDRRYLMKGDKIAALGWRAETDFSEGFRRTLDFYAARMKNKT